MNNNFIIKDISQNYIQENLVGIGFDKNYLSVAQNKYCSKLIKIFNLTPIQATILKQTALSVGTDCAVNRNVLTHNIDFTDVILFATNAQLKEIIKKLYSQQFNLKTLANNLDEYINNKLKELTIRNNKFNWNKTYLMGILNVTPNSFSDGGEFLSENDALSHFAELLENGADIIDIGAESTAPGNEQITSDEEIRRLKNILYECRKKHENVVISVDTRNAETAKFAIKAGADIINDVSGLLHDENMAQIIADSNAFVVLTFDTPIENNTQDETIKGLLKRVNIATSHGINKDKLILDVGIGFNKTFEQNIELIKFADEVCSIGFPVLYGISRKSFIQKITNLHPKETEYANISLASYLATKGVNILRVHDVKAHKIAFRALDRIQYD